MRYITEGELRATFAREIPEHYEVPKDAKLTPAARQYLMDLRLFRPGCGAGGSTAPKANANAVANAAADGKKPEHMTHLRAGELVPKTHPRIALRGELDVLEAQIIMAQLQLCQAGFECCAVPLEDALRLVRQVLTCEVLDQPLPAWKMDGMDEKEIHELSHHPKLVYSKGHVFPEASQGLAAAHMNLLRSLTRRVELCAAQAFCEEGGAQRTDLIQALNRLSSYFYILQLRAAARKEGAL